jgi:hypothetical protein
MKPRNYFGIGLLLIVGIVYTTVSSGVPQKQKTSQQQDTLYTYKKNIFPMLEANCKPCHFPGGKVYKKLPFDDSVTVAHLGKKLNTRLKKKEQQEIVKRWVERETK